LITAIIHTVAHFTLHNAKITTNKRKKQQ